MNRIKLMCSVLISFSLVFQSCSKEEVEKELVLGCMDVAACNFDKAAQKEDGSCQYGTTWFQDADGDGLGNPKVSVTNCSQPVGYVANSSDVADLEVVAKQRAVITYVGATWCGPCGAYGDPTKKYIENKFGNDVVILNVQYQDAISSSKSFGPKFGNVFQAFVSSNGIPYIYFSATNYSMRHRGFTSSAAVNNNAANTDVNACLSSKLEVGVAAKATISGNIITINTLSKFYTVLGEHYIGVYLLEDGVMAKQAGSPSGVSSHENVMRAAANTSTTLGIESLGTSFKANQKVSGNYTITIPSSVVNKSNLQVAVVVYKKNKPDGISNAVLVDVK